MITRYVSSAISLAQTRSDNVSIFELLVIILVCCVSSRFGSMTVLVQNTASPNNLIYLSVHQVVGNCEYDPVCNLERPAKILLVQCTPTPC